MFKHKKENAQVCTYELKQVSSDLYYNHPEEYLPLTTDLSTCLGIFRYQKYISGIYLVQFYSVHHQNTRKRGLTCAISPWRRPPTGDGVSARGLRPPGHDGCYTEVRSPGLRGPQHQIVLHGAKKHGHLRKSKVLVQLRSLGLFPQFHN